MRYSNYHTLYYYFHDQEASSITSILYWPRYNTISCISTFHIMPSIITIAAVRGEHRFDDTLISTVSLNVIVIITIKRDALVDAHMPRRSMANFIRRDADIILRIRLTECRTAENYWHNSAQCNSFALFMASVI